MSVTNLIDQPVAQFDEDEPLGLSRYAMALTDFIIDCETPITIGIQGDWGVGKTSLLNMVKDQLGPKRGRQAEYPVIYFNTWQYAQLDQEDHLTVAMLNDIVQRIQDLNSTPPTAQEKAGEILDKVGNIAMNVGNQLAKNKAGVDLQQGVQEASENGAPPFLEVMQLMVEYKEQFRDLVEAFMEDKHEGSRLVIMIDDLDRIRPARALDLLSSVKNFLDVPHCVFVLAVDYSVIQRGVEEKLGASERKQHGKSYFDKIIQVPFEMPVSSYQVDQYIMSLLGWEWDEKSGKYKRTDDHADDLYFKNHRSITENEAKEIENFALLTVGKNPRSIKRAVNYFGLLKRVFDENGGAERAANRTISSARNWQSLYLKIMFGLSCFQLSYPELFDLFVQKPTPQRLHDLGSRDFLNELPEMERVRHRVDDLQAVKSEVIGFFEHFISVLDANDDWQITAEEFQPVWDVVRFANLAGGTISRTDNTWADIQGMIQEYAEDAGTGDEEMERMTAALELLKGSAWNNPLHLRAEDVGNHFFTLFWDRTPIGSITSTQENPLQFYVIVDSFESFVDLLSSTAAEYVTNAGEDHYGEGTVRIHLRSLLSIDRPESLKLLKELKQAVLSQD